MPIFGLLGGGGATRLQAAVVAAKMGLKHRQAARDGQRPAECSASVRPPLRKQSRMADDMG
jgi:hypothetical protein